MQFAVNGQNGVMPVIKRKSSKPYRWEIISAPLTKIANVEKKLPAGFITKDGFGMTKELEAIFNLLLKVKLMSLEISIIKLVKWRWWQKN